MRRCSDIEDQEKGKMMLSRETLEGIRITGTQKLIHAVCMLICVPGGLII